MNRFDENNSYFCIIGDTNVIITYSNLHNCPLIYFKGDKYLPTKDILDKAIIKNKTHKIYIDYI